MFKTKKNLRRNAKQKEHKNIKRLLDAWTIIFDKGFSPTLHLTIPVSNVELIDLTKLRTPYVV